MPNIRMQTREQMEALSLIPRCDALAFVRLNRMMQQGMPLILSDETSCLLVQSDPLSPTWLWTANDCSDETLAEILFSLSALREQGRLSALIAKNRFIRLAVLAFESEIAKKQHLIVYRMTDLHSFSADGERIPGGEVPPETAGELIAALAAVDGETLTPALQRDMGTAFSKSHETFAWRTEAGEIASIAKVASVGTTYSDIHTVYTREALRNRGYAKALLSSICADLLAAGRTPMLYADRDYVPSNATYRTLGFTDGARLTALRLK